MQKNNFENGIDLIGKSDFLDKKFESKFRTETFQAEKLHF